jgi:hypothetical protein
MNVVGVLLKTHLATMLRNKAASIEKMEKKITKLPVRRYHLRKELRQIERMKREFEEWEWVQFNNTHFLEEKVDDTLPKHVNDIINATPIHAGDNVYFRKILCGEFHCGLVVAVPRFGTFQIQHEELRHHVYLDCVLPTMITLNEVVIQGEELKTLYQALYCPDDSLRRMFMQCHVEETLSCLTRVMASSPLFDPDVITYVLLPLLDPPKSKSIMLFTFLP